MRCSGGKGKCVMAMKMVKVTEVTPGCILGDAVLSGNGKVLLGKDVVLTSRGIALLNAWDVQCVYIHHSEEASIDLPPLESVEKGPYEESQKFFQEYDTIITNTVQSFEFIRKQKFIPVPHLKNAAASIHSSIVKNGGVVTNKLLVSDYRVADYISRHSVMVSFWAGIIASHMKWKEEDIRGVTLAGLLHEVGTLLVDKVEGASQSPAYIAEAATLLKESKGLTGEVILGVIQHRECIDGSGFPTRVNGLKIHPYAKVIAVADVFHSQAYTSEYSNPFPVLDMLAKEMFGKLDPSVCHTFINRVRDSLLHNKIRLSDGREAEVIFFNPTGSSLPIVKTVDNQIVDLSQHRGLTISQIIAQH